MLTHICLKLRMNIVDYVFLLNESDTFLITNDISLNIRKLKDKLNI